MKKITLSPMPTMQFHLRWGDLPAKGPVGWSEGYYRTSSDNACREWPYVSQRYWKPSYWTLWLRVWLHGSVAIKAIDPQQKRPYVATFDNEPRFATEQDMLTYMQSRNVRVT